MRITETYTNTSPRTVVKIETIFEHNGQDIAPSFERVFQLKPRERKVFFRRQYMSIALNLHSTCHLVTVMFADDPYWQRKPIDALP